VVLGSYFELMGQFQLMGRVIEVETGKILGADQQNGAVADFMVLEDRLAEGLVPYLADGGGGKTGATDPVDKPKVTSGGRVRGEGSDEPVESVAVAEPEPVSARGGAAVASADPLGAALAFSEGLDYLDRKDIERARDALNRAVELDPTLDAARDELARINI
jgi:hypothetical protein